MARCGSDADCLQREEEKWGEERVSETQRQNFWLLFWLLGQVNIFHNSPFRSGELFFLYRASFGCRMQPITVVHYPSAEALTGQPLFHPSCARVFFPLYIPVCSCSRPCLKQRVPRQLVLTTASSAAARWHPLGLSHPRPLPGASTSTPAWGMSRRGDPAKRILKGCGYSLPVAILANALSPWNKRLIGVQKNTYCAAWHMVRGLVKLQSPSKSVRLFLLISLEL